MPPANSFSEFEAKMRAAGLSGPTIRAFERSYSTLLGEQTSLVRIRESRIEPVADLPRFASIVQTAADPSLLSQTVVLKLNGGLGTGMGLDGPKSLLKVKADLTFLDIIARQILHQRLRQGVNLRLLLMNSFSTSRETLAFLRRYPDLGEPKKLELLQSMVPKVDAATLRPVQWTHDPELEWCPPGHGDIYPSLVASGWLERLLNDSVKYLFVSNSDNLGATLDLNLLGFFAASGRPFLMEVAERTAADRKGGHLARAQGKLILRERAQCPEFDLAAFEDIQRHRFFNTNNLWIRLDSLDKMLKQFDGFIPLPVIRNDKTVDPRIKASPKVYQLETAMGAAIECFEDAGAIVVPRSRFAPVKTTSDLLGLRSDAYVLTEDQQMVLAPSRKGVPPAIDLDGDHFKLMDQFDGKLRDGVPSLVDCQELIVRGPVLFNGRVKFQGKVKITNRAPEARPLPEGTYLNCEREV
ncbi:MAG: UTP--glucose-1-phosphate uridylyltransferase [Verrucomicrobia bacterium]|nr:UTP--glucose-1-phosphate uridylyltransferase [Verrucomicrobiota bacterium]